ncbi:hypothetical protein CTAYLR_003990 [Chrysophaeum taylorii]|uniref:AB hydrolase-1 domain-containing protein n=1 Tax=Chrysophaeum taylorii TaxID=2483200 RepID=A0AAD7XFX7_9STRA|nr:hypothetical protein CTAYLR_003990 [Chrysophaeum taylorii]
MPPAELAASSSGSRLLARFKSTLIRARCQTSGGVDDDDDDDDDFVAEYEADAEETEPELLPLCRNSESRPLSPIARSTFSTLDDEDDDDDSGDGVVGEEDDVWAAYSADSDHRESELAMLPPAAPPVRRGFFAFAAVARSPPRRGTDKTRRNVRIFDDGIPLKSFLAPPVAATCNVTPTMRTTDSNEEAPSVLVPVYLVDGTRVRVGARTDDRAEHVQQAVVLRLGVSSEHASSLSLYALADDLPEQRIDPATPASALDFVAKQQQRKIVLAVRLFTPPLLRTARRGFHQKATTAEAAVAHLLYAQAVAGVMTGALPLPSLEKRRRRRRCRKEGEEDPYSEFLCERSALLSSPSSLTRGNSFSSPKTTSSSASSSLLDCDEDPDLLSTEEACAVRFGALRLWSRAGDLIEEEATQHLGIITAAVRLARDYGVLAFVPPAGIVVEERGETFWKARLLNELDFLLKVQVKANKRLSSSSSSSSSSVPPPASEEGITIEVFENERLAALHTITVKKTPESPRARRSGPGAAFALLGAACYLRLAALSPLYGATVFACWARRRRSSDDEAAEPPATTRQFAAISVTGVVVYNDRLEVLETVALAHVRRWVCDPTANLVRFESEKEDRLPQQQQQDPSDRTVRRARAMLRRRLRVLSSTPKEHHQAADVDDDDDEDAINASPPKRVLFDAFRSLFFFFEPTTSPTTTTTTAKSSASVGERIHAALEEEDDDALDCGEEEEEEERKTSMVYEIHLVAAQATNQLSSELVTLLDDYFYFDLIDAKPKCKYDSAFSTSTEKVLGGRPTVYKALVSAVVRPPRFTYDTRILGPSSFDFAGCRFFRHDLVLRNKDGHRLHCSHWKPVGCANHLESLLQYKSPRNKKQPPPKTPAVIFMHANSASRVQACTYLSVVLSLGYSLFAFDCAGSGVSDGRHVTLGWREAYDLLVVVAYLRERDDVGPIAVWGHSMGAAAAIYYQSFARGKPYWPKLDCCVLDSPYSDFAVLADHLVRSNPMLGAPLAYYLARTSVARTALGLVLDAIDLSVQHIAQVSPLTDLNPIQRAHHCSAPALFLQARNDKIIATNHVEDLANKYAGPRKLAIIDGTHSSPRNGAARKFVALYLKKHLKVPAEHRYPNFAMSARDAYLEALPWQRLRPPPPLEQQQQQQQQAPSS